MYVKFSSHEKQWYAIFTVNKMVAPHKLKIYSQTMLGHSRNTAKYYIFRFYAGLQHHRAAGYTQQELSFSAHRSVGSPAVSLLLKINEASSEGSGRACCSAIVLDKVW
jgi:hypothetical protein